MDAITLLFVVVVGFIICLGFGVCTCYLVERTLLRKWVERREAQRRKDESTIERRRNRLQRSQTSNSSLNLYRKNNSKSEDTSNSASTAITPETSSSNLLELKEYKGEPNYTKRDIYREEDIMGTTTTTTATTPNTTNNTHPQDVVISIPSPQNGSSNKNNKEGEDSDSSSEEDEDNPMHRKPKDSQTYDSLYKFLAGTDYHKNKQNNLSNTKDIDKHLDMIDDANISNNNNNHNNNSNQKKERKKKQLAIDNSKNSNDSNVPNPTLQIWNDTVGVNLP